MATSKAAAGMIPIETTCVFEAPRPLVRPARFASVALAGGGLLPRPLPATGVRSIRQRRSFLPGWILCEGGIVHKRGEGWEPRRHEDTKRQPALVRGSRYSPCSRRCFLALRAQ